MAISSTAHIYASREEAVEVVGGDVSCSPCILGAGLEFSTRSVYFVMNGVIVKTFTGVPWLDGSPVYGALGLNKLRVRVRVNLSAPLPARGSAAAAAPSPKGASVPGPALQGPAAAAVSLQTACLQSDLQEARNTIRELRLALSAAHDENASLRAALQQLKLAAPAGSDGNPTVDADPSAEFSSNPGDTTHSAADPSAEASATDTSPADVVLPFWMQPYILASHGASVDAANQPTTL